MQRLTGLKLKELNNNFQKEKKVDLGNLLSSIAVRGAHKGYHKAFLQIEFKYVDKLLDGLLSTEKEALTAINSQLKESYFSDLKEEFIKLFNDVFNLTRSTTLEMIERIGQADPNEIIYLVGKQESLTRDNIINKIEILEQEINLGIGKTPPGTVFNIIGNVGALNTGVVYGSVQGEIKKIRESDGNKIAELFDKLLDTINNSDVSGNIRTEQMQNVELLVQQYSKPQKERNYGLINASLTFLSVATNLSTLWSQYGQAIIDAFK